MAGRQGIFSEDFSSVRQFASSVATLFGFSCLARTRRFGGFRPFRAVFGFAIAMSLEMALALTVPASAFSQDLRLDQPPSTGLMPAEQGRFATAALSQSRRARSRSFYNLSIAKAYE